MTNRAYAKSNGDGLLCSILCQNHGSISCTLVKFSLAAAHTNKSSLSKIWHDYSQGRRNDVKARGADFRERALLN